MIAYKEYKTRQSWLKGRTKTLGASEVSAAMGQSTFMTPTQLWELKTSEKTETDDEKTVNEQIAYGTEAEQYLRGLFALKHKKDFDIVYHPFRVYTNDAFPHLSCTLDGELLGKADAEYAGLRGVWECKTAEIHSKKAADEWEGEHIPQKYYLQLLAQLLVTNFDFAILNAELRYSDGSAVIREYRVSRAEVEDDMREVAKQTAAFWRNVETHTKPKVVLRL